MRVGILMIGSALMLSGCMEASVPTPRPTFNQLKAACEVGDRWACEQAVVVGRRNAELSQAAGDKIMQNL